MLAYASAATVKIQNSLGPGVTAKVNCASKDDTIEEKNLDDGQSFEWEFTPNLLGNTLYWCDVTTSDGKSKHWDVYKDGVNTCFSKDISNSDRAWYMRGDGIYRGSMQGADLCRQHTW